MHSLLDIYDEREISFEEASGMLEFLKVACERASKMERMADKAEYEIDKVQVISYIKQHIGEEVEAFIESIHPSYVTVRSKGLMDGVILLEDFNDSVYFLPSGKLKSSISGRTYKVGHKILVSIKDATYADKTIFYKLVDNLTLSEVEEVKRLKKNVDSF